MKASLEKQDGREFTLEETNEAIRTLRIFARISQNLFLKNCKGKNYSQNIRKVII
jgi:hypothetical protein